MTRLEQIRKRLEAATPSAYLNNKWPFTMIDRDADWDFIEHAPLDVRDLLEMCDIVRRTFIPAYLVAFGPDGTLKFHVDQNDLRAIWDAFSKLDAPVGDKGNDD